MGTRFLAKTSAGKYHEKVDAFFTKMNTPVDYEKEHGHKGNDTTQFKILGYMCLVYGGFISLLALIPNEWIGRLCFVFVGGIMLVVGGIFVKFSKRKMV